MPSRRRMLTGSVAAALWLASGRSPRARAQAPTLAPELEALFVDALALGRAVRRRELTPTQWQDLMAALLARVPAASIARGLDLEHLRRRARRLTRGCFVLPLAHPAALGGDEGAAMRLFFFEPGRTDPPHVHFNSVTTHLVLEGRFRVQHWDRVREERGGFVLRQTHDRTIGPGESTSISEQRDNGHWHQCLARGVLLDVEQGRIDPTIPPRNRQMVDLSAATRDGEFFAPSIGRATAMRRYG